jgi:hypothetical protein
MMSGELVSMRASGLAELFDCQARWKAHHIDKIHSPTYGRSHLGTSVHMGTGWFDNETTLDDGNPDVEIAVDKFLETLNDDQNVVWTDIPKNKAKDIGVALVNKYCTEISPQFEWVKVEALCEPIELTMPNGVIFEITGHVDRVYRANGGHGIVDVKTGYGVIDANDEVAVDKHGVQLSVYELLEMMAEAETGIRIDQPALIIGMSTSGSPRIEVAPVENPRSLLFGDDEHIGYLEAASKIVEDGAYVGNTRSMLCNPRYCPAFETCFYVRGKQA